MIRFLIALMLSALASAATAQTYPTRAITLVVPFAAGGPTDVVARIAANHMSRELGQQIIIENVAGAGGTTGAARVARAVPDGYTMLLGQMGTHALSVALYPQLSYDPVRDFEPIGLVASAPQVLVVKKTVPAQTLEEFVAYARTSGSKLNNGHAGIGATSQVACLLFNFHAGASPTYVAYRGTAPALSDLVAGQIDYMCDQVTNIVGQATAGTIKPLAVFAPTRSPVLPDVPTSAEAGMPQLDAVVWNGLFFPRATPKAIVGVMNAALAKALDDATTRRRFLDLGAETPTASARAPEAFGDLVKREIDRWTPLIRGAGLTGN